MTSSSFFGYIKNFFFLFSLILVNLSAASTSLAQDSRKTKNFIRGRLRLDFFEKNDNLFF